jgi:flavin reductase (DIM6/NTAB) family NADH-FMN oxidoreductase RutF
LRVTIHASDPFATPEDQRSPYRRFRGRLPSPVTIWTAGTGVRRTGLTVSSMLVADGDPARVIALIDDESSLWDELESTRRAAITMLRQGEHLVGDRFAGLLPSPGGLFADGDWVDSDFGPVPADATTWVGVTLEGSTPCGYALLVTATITETHMASDGGPPLVHVRGRYRGLAE